MGDIASQADRFGRPSKGIRVAWKEKGVSVVETPGNRPMLGHYEGVSNEGAIYSENKFSSTTGRPYPLAVRGCSDTSPPYRGG